MRRIVGKAMVVALVFAATSLGADELPEQPYEWTCKAQGFFQMKVSPDGRYTPTADASPTGPIHIMIQRRSEEEMVWYRDTAKIPRRPIGGLDPGYTVSLTGQTDHPFKSGEKPDYYDSGVKFDFPLTPDPAARRQGLKGVEAIYWTPYQPQILSIKAASRDWVFFVYAGSLTSDAEARHQNIVFPYGNQRDANAETDFLTGPCVRER